MSAHPGLDELTRAANAAGYAMATIDDDTTPSAEGPGRTVAISVEDLARGARRVAGGDQVPAVATARPQAQPAPKGLMAGAHTVRETVYGYLGFGVPA